MATKKSLECGLIMPISAIDGCSAEHWDEVKNIITESVESITENKFLVSLVSDADEVGVIQKRIVQNVYSSDIVVCDVSGKNPNVMFELGMRLAFDKPTVIVKDDKTDYSFDTGIIEHVTYPRDLRFSKIVTFKKKLAEKVSASYKKSLEDTDHSTFLKNFGKFHVANLSEDIITPDKMVIEMLSEMQQEIRLLRNRTNRSSSNGLRIPVSFRLGQFAKSWVKKHDCDIQSLLGNEEFYDYAEERLDAQEHFQSRDEFIEAMNTQIEKLVA